MCGSAPWHATRRSPVRRSCCHHLPLLAEAMPYVAHLAVRNRGTFGGSIAFADPAAELPACALALDARLVLDSICRPARNCCRGLLQRPARHRPPCRRADRRGGDSDRVQRDARVHRASTPPWRFRPRRPGVPAAAREGIIADGRLAYFASEDRPKLALRDLAAIKGKPLGPRDLAKRGRSSPRGSDPDFETPRRAPRAPPLAERADPPRTRQALAGNRQRIA